MRVGEMIVRDKETNIIGQHDPNDPTYLDFGDASRSSGIMSTFYSEIDQKCIVSHYTKDGFVRCPKPQKTWNEPGNFSRDQLMCLASGLYYSGNSRLLLIHWDKQYWTGFCPNWDILAPGAYFHYILCAKVWWMYWFGLIGYPWQILDILYSTLIRPHGEQNQIICVAKRSGLLKFWAFCHPFWKRAVLNYWGLKGGDAEWRDQIEIGEYLVREIEDDIK
jgi:hypothetical protein